MSNMHIKRMQCKLHRCIHIKHHLLLKVHPFIWMINVYYTLYDKGLQLWTLFNCIKDISDMLQIISINCNEWRITIENVNIYPFLEQYSNTSVYECLTNVLMYEQKTITKNALAYQWWLGVQASCLYKLKMQAWVPFVHHKMKALRVENNGNKVAVHVKHSQR